MALTLRDLIQLESNYRDIVSNGKIRIVRHTMKNNAGLDEMLKFDQEALLAFASWQTEDKFADAEIVLMFTATTGTNCVFRGAFSCNGKLSSARAWSDFYSKSTEIKAKCLPETPSDNHQFYRLSSCELLKEFQNRLVIDWGAAPIVWCQTKLDKSVFEILPEGFVDEFPGWQDVLISHQKLQALISHPDGNRDWHQYLSEHDGVYVIRDRASSKLYVGCAHSDDKTNGGIWGRWRGYAQTGHNGNKGLVELEFGNFIYSIHFVTPKSKTSKNEVRKYERLLKEKLGTREGDEPLNWN